MPAKARTHSLGEFVALTALMTSLVALSIDAMLPALPLISAELGVTDENDRQHVISMLFLGMAVGQILYGPVSDRIGRKVPVMVGLVLFILGSVLSAVATSFEWMLWGRFIQGLGAAGPRIVSVAIVRDQYEGNLMGKIMSLIMMVFILVPALAPGIGLGIMSLFNWRMIYWFFVLLALVASLWFWWRQPETLSEIRRVTYSAHSLVVACREVITNRFSGGYMLSAGLIFGAFIGYLNSAQQIFQELYGTGDWFALYFAVLALSIGFSSYVNSRLVTRLGMVFLTRHALIALTVLSVVFFVLCLWQTPALNVLMAYLILCFFCIGILFGNFNAMAMEPMGHIAGLASALIGSVTTLISLCLGYWVGALYDDSVLPLVTGFALLSGLSLVLVLWIERTRAQ